MLNCPRCQSPLTPHSVTTDVEGWQVEIDACDQGCGGLWIEPHDFEADAEARLLLDQELVSLNRGRAVDTTGPVDCPEGHGPLHRFNWNNENIHLDTCETCQGRWLDGGEIANIQAEWGREPLDAQEMTALVAKTHTVKDATDSSWDDGNFGSWFLKRLAFSSFRGRFGNR